MGSSIKAYWFDFGGGVVPTSFFNPLIPLAMFYKPPQSSASEFDKYDEPRLHMERLLKAKLVEFDISLRILIQLESAGIKTLGDLIKTNHKSLMQIPQIGENSVNVLHKLLDRLDLSFSE